MQTLLQRVSVLDDHRMLIPRLGLQRCARVFRLLQTLLQDISARSKIRTILACRGFQS